MAVANLTEKVTDLFQGNPFATEVGHKIEQASDPKLGSENWALFMEICDLINESEESAKDAARAIRKRLHVVMPAKDFEAAQLVLTVLETCVKNCNRRFQALVCSKDFAHELVKTIGPANKPPVILQERVLGLVQSWAETFRNTAELRGVTEVYDELKSKGIDFPVLDMDATAPIITPQKTVTTPPVQPATPRRTSLNPPTHSQQQQYQDHFQGQEIQHIAGPVNLTPEQLAKMRNEVDVVKGNLQVFTEMLGEMKPGQEDPDDLQLLIDLHQTIRAMQDRIVQLLGAVNNEEVTAELLVVNDDMNSLFLRYERFERQRKGAGIQARALPQLPAQTSSRTEPGSSGSSTLIDFGGEKRPANAGDVDMLQTGVGSIGLGRNSPRLNMDPNDSDTEDFGAFAMSRVGQSQPGIPIAGPTLLPKDSELTEMESWLKSQSAIQPQPGLSDRPALSSSEFDKFLESRAVAAEQLPSVSASNNRTGGEKEASKDKEEHTHLLD
ncbi:TOM1-like protein 2 [Hypsibius exemplaris]|uniref:TOM1-like protein 2 n=1 Tax=Hypsibius exemplaris TaxID=2072580 RepID=A0A1W0XCH5_HYPEX|nr:TOM1-like protein 2 [Hypsibius exemplaris]